MKENEQKNGHLAQLAEHWFEWIASQMDVGSNPTVRGMGWNGRQMGEIPITNYLNIYGRRQMGKSPELKNHIAGVWLKLAVQ